MRIIVLNALIGFGLNCGGGIDTTIVGPGSEEETEQTETPSKSKTWTENFTTGHTNKYDADRALDINNRYSYDFFIGFNGYDLHTQKAKITFKTISEPYDGEIQRSDPPQPETPFQGETRIEYLLTGESRKYDTDKKTSTNGERHYDTSMTFNEWDSATKKASITLNTIHELYTGY